MTILYKKVITPSGAMVINATFTDSDRLLSIPLDPDNTDYQEYLEWLADGGVPEEADA